MWKLALGQTSFWVHRGHILIKVWPDTERVNMPRGVTRGHPTDNCCTSWETETQRSSDRLWVTQPVRWKLGQELMLPKHHIKKSNEPKFKRLWSKSRLCYTWKYELSQRLFVPSSLWALSVYNKCRTSIPFFFTFDLRQLHQNLTWLLSVVISSTASHLENPNLTQCSAS